MPRSCVEMAGVSLSHWPVSHTSARSAFTSLPCLARKPGSDGEPHLLLALEQHGDARSGSSPATFFQARAASKKVISWPLLSSAPRATITLPLALSEAMRGSNGGDFHSSSGIGAAARRSGRRTARAGRRVRAPSWSWPTTIGCPVVGTTRASKPMSPSCAGAPFGGLLAVRLVGGVGGDAGDADQLEQPLQRRILRGVERLQDLVQLGRSCASCTRWRIPR